MKAKLLVAYESESSSTTRITPYQIGQLFGKIPVSALPQFFDGLDSTRLFAVDTVKESQEDEMRTWLAK